MGAEQSSAGKVINFAEARKHIIIVPFRGAEDSTLQEPRQILDFQEPFRKRELLSLGDLVMQKITKDLVNGGFVVERNNPEFEKDVKVVLSNGRRHYYATQCASYLDDYPEDEPTTTLSIDDQGSRCLVFDTTTDDLPYTLLLTQEGLPLDHISSVEFMREILGATVDTKSTRESFGDMKAAFENKQDSPFRVYWLNPVRIA